MPVLKDQAGGVCMYKDPVGAGMEKPRTQRHRHPLSFFCFVLVGVRAPWRAGTSPLNSKHFHKGTVIHE